MTAAKSSANSLQPTTRLKPAPFRGYCSPQQVTPAMAYSATVTSIQRINTPVASTSTRVRQCARDANKKSAYSADYFFYAAH